MFLRHDPSLDGLGPWVTRSQKTSLAAEMQWQLLPPLSLDSGRVSVAGLIQPAYDVGGNSFDYAVTTAFLVDFH